MFVLSVFYNSIITPIALAIEVVFCFYLKQIRLGGAAGAIIAVSIAVNFLALPLYNKAEMLQEKERGIQRRLAPGIKRIKTVFRGDERFMMMQAFYRENKYHPFQALRASLSILIEIPFFIAAYRFLSHCPALKDASFLILHDLSAPDALLPLPWGAKLNLLPVLMTLVNAASGAVYLKGLSLRDKLQTYILAAVFLVLLYASPSGLVFYWLLNNLFSLVKNVVMLKCRHRGRVVYAAVSCIMIAAGLYIAICHPPHNIARRIAVAVLPGIVCAIPLAWKLGQKTASAKIIAGNGSGAIATAKTDDEMHTKSLFLLFLSSALALAMLCGLVLPANVIGTSPIEFSFIGDTPSPLSYIWHCIVVFTGLFVMWPLAIYFMFRGKVQSVMPMLFSFLLIAAILNTFAFANNYGRMDTFFHLDDSHVLLDYSARYTSWPLLASLATAALLYAVHRKRWERHLATLSFAVCAAAVVWGISKIPRINETYKKYAAERASEAGDNTLKPIYHLSRTKKNVAVLFYDRAISSFFPYILQQFPQLKDDFSGFVYYPNTLSFGGNTLVAAPAMMGGYEYTPEAMNKRPKLLLREKHNKATLLLPSLFNKKGYAVTVTDPPYPNYEWSGDASPFDGYSNTECSFVEQSFYTPYMNRVFGGDDKSDKSIVVKGHALMFCLMQALLPFFRYLVYDGADYLQGSRAPIKCIAQYGHLYFLPEITDCTSALPSYLFITNDLTHTPALLKEDDAQEVQYMPAANVGKDDSGTGLYKWKEAEDKEYYQVNAAAMLLTARYLNKLKAMGVYDNTRIIIVADHGKNCYTPAWPNRGLSHANENPLLLVKDFGASGPVKTDNALMTNADTSFLAAKGLDLDAKNPFTGNSLPQSLEKKEVRIFAAEEDAADIKKAHKWILSGGYSVSGSIFNEDNWHRISTPPQ